MALACCQRDDGHLVCAHTSLAKPTQVNTLTAYSSKSLSKTKVKTRTASRRESIRVQGARPWPAASAMMGTKSVHTLA